MSDPPLLIADLLPPLVQTALYTLTSLAVATQFTPYLRSRLLGYGKTIQTPTTSHTDPDYASKGAQTENGQGTKNPIEWLFTTTVPHSWFVHFYALALTLMGGIVANILLPVQFSPLKATLALEIPAIVVEHPWFQAFAGGLLKEGQGRASVDWWVIACVTAQVGRRLWEDMTLGGKVWSERERERMWLGGEIVLVKEDPIDQVKTTTDNKTEQNGGKKPESRMPLPIYISGLLFYTLLPLSTISPSTHTLLSFSPPPIPLSPFSLLTMPPLYILLLLPTFFILSGTQHDIHIYLSTLIKYTLPPAKSWFSWTVAPHYGVEGAIYFILVLMAYCGPADREGAGAMLAVMVFVWTNLTLLGERQRAWYGERFGAEKVGARGGMWPLLW